MRVYDVMVDYIISRLNTTGVTAEFLETDADANRKPYTSRFVVYYAGSEFNESATGGIPDNFGIGKVVQSEYAHFGIVVQAKKLKGNNECYDLIQKAKDVLLGYSVPGIGSPLFFKEIKDNPENKDGIHSWLIIIGSRLSLIANLPAETVVPITEVNFQIV
jgi:hypothetical protein